jgi:hypothetical protein
MHGKFFLGKWAFIAGLILAILSGFLVIPGLSLVLFMLGITVGFMNIRKKDITPYLVAIIALIVVSSSIILIEEPYLPKIGLGLIKSVLANFVAFVSASGLVIAIRAILMLGSEE